MNAQGHMKGEVTGDHHQDPVLAQAPQQGNARATVEKGTEHILALIIELIISETMSRIHFFSKPWLLTDILKKLILYTLSVL